MTARFLRYIALSAGLAASLAAPVPAQEAPQEAPQEATDAAANETAVEAPDATAAAPAVAPIVELLRSRLPVEAVFLSSDELVMMDPTALTLDMFLWVARPLVVFADSPNDPRFIQQMEYIDDRFAELTERDVVVIVDTDPAANSAIRRELRPRGFDLVLIGKDGFKYLRKPSPWDVREISRSIDKMPLRQQELRDMRGK